ncbi:MAG: diguanylate cyclase [Deltaproteobacteria bacterium]|nr:diguanylate cyclase [Deltaproteobacteria bacterium]
MHEMRVLLACGDSPECRPVAAWLEADGFEIARAVSLDEAREREAEVDLVLIDEALGVPWPVEEPGGAAGGNGSLLVLGRGASLASALEALRRRAVDYLPEPWTESLVRERVGAAAALQSARREREAELVSLRRRCSELEAMAVRDSLTGLYNHAYFQERLSVEMSRSRRYGHPLGLLFIDVDEFKRINDSLGHLVGDAVLRGIASILRGSSRSVDVHFRLRQHDIAARYGGDEFVLLLPETPRAGAAITAERLRLCVEDHDFGPAGSVSLSIGVACFPDDGADRDALIAAADLALYAAKQSGRNRVITYSPALESIESDGSWEEQIDIRRLVALQRTIAFVGLTQSLRPLRAGDGRISGQEAICQPSEPEFGDLQTLLQVAERSGKVAQLGRVMRERSLEGLKQLEDDQLLFLRVHPREVFDPELAAGDGLERVVYMLDRIREIDDSDQLRAAVDRLREAGCRIGLAGLPAGYTGLDRLLGLRPDYVEIDLHEVGRGDARCDLLARHMIECASAEGVTVVAAGLQGPADRDRARSLGCDLIPDPPPGDP